MIFTYNIKEKIIIENQHINAKGWSNSRLPESEYLKFKEKFNLQMGLKPSGQTYNYSNVDKKDLPKLKEAWHSQDFITIKNMTAEYRVISCTSCQFSADAAMLWLTDFFNPNK